MGYQNLTPISVIILVLTPLIVGDDKLSLGVISQSCSSKCGDIIIPYPFGIGEGCYYVDPDNPGAPHIMNITCDRSNNPPVPILGKNVQIFDISLQEADIYLKYYVSYDCYDEGLTPANSPSRADLVTFTVSSKKNKFVVTGCDSYAWFRGLRYGKAYSTGCMTQCGSLDEVTNECNGVGCCQVSIPDGVTNIKTTTKSFLNHSTTPFNPCTVAYPVANYSATFSKNDLKKGSDYYLANNHSTSVVFNWGIGTKNCTEAEKDGSFLCTNNTGCFDLKPDQDGYRCKCNEGFAGNPYLSELHQGCEDINECDDDKKNECTKAEYCTNTPGNYTCECPTGYHGNAKGPHGCVFWLLPVIVTAGIGAGTVIILVIWFLLYRRSGQREFKKLRESHFRQNGGLILHQKISGIEVLKIFTTQELENATEKYNEANIIGRGGFGIVYKGVLQSNKQVAIKRSLKVDPDQVEQFINEVLILSQINNRHVVKLLGCCLETEVPLLVYEFINNGTLYDHLHDETRVRRLTWSIRLKIATEIADVLSYLHTTIATPIIHRDMKSMNILLDEIYTPKVADFGASKLVPLDQDQLATMVIGTQGYLDPEYMRTFELTEKSDVYSFGVVLVELLTKEKALNYQKPEVERCLAMYFLLKMKDNSLLDIVDKTLSIDDEEVEQIKEVAKLAKWCLGLKGEERPTMKDVAMELERIKRMVSHPGHNARKSFDQPENYAEHLIQMATNDDNGNTGGKESDVSSLLSFVAPLGDGR